MNATKTTYRILTSEGLVKYTGTTIGSWFTLEDAKKLVNRNNGEMIYKFSMQTMTRLFEVM
jgi:hypothetical protein